MAAGGAEWRGGPRRRSWGRQGRAPRRPAGNAAHLRLRGSLHDDGELTQVRLAHPGHGRHRELCLYVCAHECDYICVHTWALGLRLVFIQSGSLS